MSSLGNLIPEGFDDLNHNMPAPPFPWLKEKPDTFRHHLENETGNFEEYTRGKRLELGRRLKQLRRIYLDTKYWLYVRDVYLGRPQKAIHADIVVELRRLRADGSTICPISYSVFEEILYQTDSSTRSATAEMIDALSDDCTIQPLFNVFKAEVDHFLKKSLRPGFKLYDVCLVVWTKAAFVLGDVFLSLKDSGIPERQALAMRKAMDDLLWSTKLSEILQSLPVGDGAEQKDAKIFAQKLTSGKFNHQNDRASFDELFLDEVFGALDGLADISGDSLDGLRIDLGFTGNTTLAQQLIGGRMLGALLRVGFEQKKLTTQIPTISIPAALHATIRFDKKRKYKKGDVVDFSHAALAVGYFDAFLTERSLKNLLTSKWIDAQKNYGCLVLAEENEVLRYLRGI